MQSTVGTALLVAGLLLQTAFGWSQSILFSPSSRRPGAFLSYNAPSAPPRFDYATSDAKSDNWIGFFPKGAGPSREGDTSYLGWAVAPYDRGVATAGNDFDQCTPAGEYEAYLLKKDRGHPLSGPSLFTYPGNPDYKRCGDGKCIRSTASCGGCRTSQRLCHHRCINDDELCDGRCGQGQTLCIDKCISIDFPCHGQCVFGRRRCNDRCINADLPCNGQCVGGDKVCNTRCINDDIPCNGQCESGKKVCNGKCIKSGILCCADGQKNCHGRCIPNSNDCNAATCGLARGASPCSSSAALITLLRGGTPEKCAKDCRSMPECKSFAAGASFHGGCWLYREDVKTCAGTPGAVNWLYSDRDCYPPPETYTPVCNLGAGDSPCTSGTEQIRYDAYANTPEKCAAACKSLPECQSYVVGYNHVSGCYLYRENLDICRGSPGASNWRYYDRDC